jgi:hypothetical protein
MTNMSNPLAVLLRSAAQLWGRLNKFLHARAERELAAWGSSLQYKRRYTNPDAAKAYRRVP